MKLNESQIIVTPEKITEYLLKPKKKDDKSKFLQALGYTKDNWFELVRDIIQIAINNNLVLQTTSEFGNLYSIKGTLKSRAVITVWLQQVSENYFKL